MSVSTAEWIAIGACVVAAVALLVAGLAWWKLRAVRASQLVLLGGGKQDLIDFAVSLQGRIDDLHRAVDEIAAGQFPPQPHPQNGRCLMCCVDSLGVEELAERARYFSGRADGSEEFVE